MCPEMKILVIKPTLKCNANCLGCTNRKQQHGSAMRERRQLSPEQWKTVIGDAAFLGAKELHISGGEPTLYENLVDMIREGKKYGMHVSMMSNGSGNGENYLEKLLKAGLDTICISLYSHLAEVHDKVRRSKNLWNKATETVRILSKLGEKFPRFYLSTMSIIMKENYRTFDELIEFHRNLGAHGMTISYLEGDFTKKYLLTEEEIMEFRNIVIPKAIQYCGSLDPRIKDISINVLKELYSDEDGSIEELANGIYWKNNYCEQSKGFALIWSNGTVVPCFMCEYTTEPVMGNVFKDSLKNLWKSDKWNAFRRNLHEKCSLCPMNLHTSLPLRYVESKCSDQNRDILHSIYYSKGFKAFRPVAKKIINLRRQYLSLKLH
jgi:radical SAM protein with 4Fe4S-binding SPASM domain